MKRPNDAPFKDGETLAFLVEKLRPSIRASIRRAIGRKFASLDACLIQLEQATAAAPELQSGTTIVREISVARVLCDSIQKDLSRS